MTSAKDQCLWLTMLTLTGSWVIGIVIATIPTFLEKDALQSCGDLSKEMMMGLLQRLSLSTKVVSMAQPRYFDLVDLLWMRATNAIWGMQFVWPIKADYRIVYLDDNYQQTIIGRNNRDYVWIMARTPSISEQDYTKLVEVVGSLGYELDALQKAIHAK